jgi:hypothetical protein
MNSLSERQKPIIRKIELQKDFAAKGDFQSLYAAQGWLHDNDYSYGSLCSPKPVGIMRNIDGKSWKIAKWKNLTREEIRTLDGVMRSDDFRNGTVTVTIYEKL